MKFTYQDKIDELKVFARVRVLRRLARPSLTSSLITPQTGEREAGSTHQTYGKAVENTQRFKQLRENVLEYGKKFDNFAEDQRIFYTEEIKTLKAELQRLEKLIKE